MQGSVSEAGNAFDRLWDVPLEHGDEVESQVYIENIFQRAQRAQNSAVLAYMQNEFDDANAFAASAKTNYELAKLSFVAHESAHKLTSQGDCQRQTGSYWSSNAPCDSIFRSDTHTT